MKQKREYGTQRRWRASASVLYECGPGAVKFRKLLAVSGGFAVENRIERGVVIHLELAIELEASLAGQHTGPECIQAGGQVIALFG